MTAAPEGHVPPIAYRPVGEEVECRNAYGLVFYLRPAEPTAAPVPLVRRGPRLPAEAPAWRTDLPQPGLLQRLATLVGPVRQGASA